MGNKQSKLNQDQLAELEKNTRCGSECDAAGWGVARLLDCVDAEWVVAEEG